MSTEDSPQTQPSASWADVNAKWHRKHHAHLSDADLVAKGLSRVPSSGRARYYAQRAATVGYTMSATVAAVAGAVAAAGALDHLTPRIVNALLAYVFVHPHLAPFASATIVGQASLVAVGALMVTGVCALILGKIGSAGTPDAAIGTSLVRFVMHIAIMVEVVWLARVVMDVLNTPALGEAGGLVYLAFLASPLIMLISCYFFREKALMRWGGMTPSAKPEAVKVTEGGES